MFAGKFRSWMEAHLGRPKKSKQQKDKSKGASRGHAGHAADAAPADRASRASPQSPTTLTDLPASSHVRLPTHTHRQEEERAAFTAPFLLLFFWSTLRTHCVAPAAGAGAPREANCEIWRRVTQYGALVVRVLPFSLLLWPVLLPSLFVAVCNHARRAGRGGGEPGGLDKAPPLIYKRPAGALVTAS